MSGTPVIAAGDDGLREHAKRRYKRTRTGCLRCRAQHRKCKSIINVDTRDMRI